MSTPRPAGTTRKRQVVHVPAAAIVPTLTEAQFQEQVTELASLCGWRWCHYPDSRRVQGHPGLPDLILTRAPRLVFAECKRQRGRLRPGQRDWIADLTASGAEVYCWRPSDWARIVEILR